MLLEFVLVIVFQKLKNMTEDCYPFCYPQLER
jgi:hypothetical protein